MRGRPAYDQIIQGLSGIMSVTGTPQTAPTRTGFPIADTLGGYAAAFAISAALVKRGRTGEGSYLDVSMLETAVAAMGWVVSDYLVAGRKPRAMGNENATSAPSGTFRTADGALNIAANKQEQYVELCTVLGRPELITDERFATRESRKLHRVELKAELEKTLEQQPASYWDELLGDTGVPVAPVLTVEQALLLDQLAERELLHSLPMPDGRDRELRVLGSSVHVDGRAVGPSRRPPGLGEHTAEVLAEHGYTSDEIACLREEGVL
jgi:crotonobetainyl-CoA:carnitine CoA-transferase CaiB-like acyl-CoA transferase